MSALAKLFVRATDRIRRTLPAADPLWSGVWLGVLPRSAMAAIDEALYSLRSNYGTAEHNRRGLADWEREALDAYFPRGMRLMVLGVGGGREVIALRRLGYDALGWESHPGLVASAQALVADEGFPGTVAAAPRDEVPTGSDVYDGAILGWSMYMLVHGRKRRIELLAALHPRLSKGGPVLLSFFTRSPDDRRAVKIHRVARPLRRILRRDPPDVGDDMLPNVVHRFTREEIEAELSAAGFRLVRWVPSGSGPMDTGWAVGLAA